MLKCVVLLIAIIQISASSQITSSTLGYKQLLQTDFQSDYKTQIIKSNNEDHVKVLLSSRGSKSNDWTQKTSNKFLMDSKKIKIFDESERNPKILTFRSKPFLNKIDLKEEKMITNNKVESLDPKSRSFNRFSIISNRKLNLPGIRSSSSFSTTNFSPGVVIRDNFNSLKDVKNIVKKFAKHFNTKRKIGFVLMTRNRLYEEGQRRKKTLLIGKAKWIVKLVILHKSLLANFICNNNYLLNHSSKLKSILNKQLIETSIFMQKISKLYLNLRDLEIFQKPKRLKVKSFPRKKVYKEIYKNTFSFQLSTPLLSFLRFRPLINHHNFTVLHFYRTLLFTFDITHFNVSLMITLCLYVVNMLLSSYIVK